MPVLSKSSDEKLRTCDDRIQKIIREVVKHYDCTVLCGFRGKDDQDQAVREGKSKLSWPNSVHNKLPSKAVDVIPYPVDWNDMKRFMHFAGFVQGVASQMGYKLRCDVLNSML